MNIFVVTKQHALKAFLFFFLATSGACAESFPKTKKVQNFDIAVTTKVWLRAKELSGNRIFIGDKLLFIPLSCDEIIDRDRTIMNRLDSLSTLGHEWLFLIYEHQRDRPFAIIHVGKYGKTSYSVGEISRVDHYSVPYFEIAKHWPSQKGFHPVIFGCSIRFKAFTIPELGDSNLTPFVRRCYKDSICLDPILRKSAVLQYALTERVSLPELIELNIRWADGYGPATGKKLSDFGKGNLDSLEKYDTFRFWLADLEKRAHINWFPSF